METIPLFLFFHDPIQLKSVGLTVPEFATVQCIPGCLPGIGDIVTHAELNYPAGDRAAFRVVARLHLFGDNSTQRIQLNVELVATVQNP